VWVNSTALYPMLLTCTWCTSCSMSRIAWLFTQIKGPPAFLRPDAIKPLHEQAVGSWADRPPPEDADHGESPDEGAPDSGQDRKPRQTKGAPTGTLNRICSPCLCCQISALFAPARILEWKKELNLKSAPSPMISRPKIHCILAKRHSLRRRYSRFCASI
jgi:hypothetical protein